MAKSRLNIAVLLSGSGRTLQNLIDERAAGRLNVDIRLVIGSKPGLGGLERAAKAELRHRGVDHKAFADVHEFSEGIFALCGGEKGDLICLAGWLELLISRP